MRHAAFFRLAAVVSVSLFILTSVASGSIPPSERAALIAFYNATGGDGWTDNSGWKTPPLDVDGFALPGTEGGWYGVSVSADQVTHLNFPPNNLNGFLPADLGSLPALQAVVIANNSSLGGSLPPELGNLSSLSSLEIYYNGLTGVVPPELGNCANLILLDLRSNQFSGGIPSTLGDLSNLDHLDLSGNQLSGLIPKQLGNLTQLRRLYLSNNALTGSLPVELSHLAILEQLHLSNNQLAGTIPTWLGNLTELRQLRMESNRFIGSIPPQLGNLTNLDTLRLTSNQLTGAIPAELVNLSNLQWLYLNDNQLSGSIPYWLGYLSQLRGLDLSANQITGTIPSQLRWLSMLEELHFSWNQLSGGLPPELGDLTNLRNLGLPGNQLTGPIPDSFSSLTLLEGLYLYNNQLSGSIPAWLGSLVNLHHLCLDGNQLTGPIPTELGALSNLVELNLAENQLSGTIPGELGALPVLHNLWLQGNQLTGGIPASLGNLSQLEMLALHVNQLTGPIPSPLGNLSNLVGLWLGNNGLDGSIPSSFGGLIQLHHLYLSSNALVGPVPAELGNLTLLETFQIDGNAIRAELPVELAGLTNLNPDWTDLGYNGFWATDPGLRAFLAGKDPDWENTQTIAPTGVSASATGPTSVRVDWSPILYTGDTGGYVVSISQTAGGPYDVWGQISDKNAGSLDVTGLGPDTDYYFVVQAWTDPHGGQPNAIYSLYSAEASAHTPLAHTVTFLAGPNGVVNGELTQLVVDGGNTSAVEAVPDPNCHFTGWTGDYTGADNPLVLSNVTAPKTVTANFEIDTHTVYFYAGAHGSLLGDTAQVVPHGGNTAPVEAVPDPYHHFLNWNGDWFGFDNPLVLYGVTGDMSVTAQFDAYIPSAERAALIAFYNATGGDGWNNNWGWKNPPLAPDGFAEPGTEPGWVGVDVQGDHVAGLALWGNNLNGVLPPEMADLTGLTYLHLWSNSLGGPLPDWLGTLAGLGSVDLNGNQFSGPIPDSMQNLLNLVSINVQYNQLNGPVPAWFGSLPNLQYLRLIHNQFTGGIPPELGNAANLQHLYLENNLLTGGIPPELGNLGQLQYLYLNNNQLTGGIPPELGQLGQLVELQLQGNELSGVVPAQLGNLGNLQVLMFNNNQLNGGLPGELGNLAQLRQLDLSNNQLNGWLPDSWQNLQELTNLQLYGNQLSGPVPTWLGSLTHLQYLNLCCNQFSGQIPPSLGNLDLRQLVLYGNQLWGSLPFELSRCVNLQQLHLQGNQLSGTIPSWIGNFTLLWQLNLGDNRFTGSIPTAIGNLTNLQELDLRGNQLTGGITADLSNLTNLRYICLSGNPLGGPLPAWFGNLWNLTSLELGNCQLTGTVPPELGNLGQLRVLLLPNNSLTGSIPWSLGNLPNLNTLDLDTNQLTGEVPESIGWLGSLQYLNLRNNQLSGDLWWDFGGLGQLRELYLSENQFTGTIPDSIGSLGQLQHLWLQNNQFEGGVPAWLGGLGNLITLGLNNNQLMNSIPASLGNLSQLQVLWLGNNQLDGEIPATFGNLTNLQLLHLSRNQLTGPVPDWIGNLTQLQTLQVNGNMLTGELPVSLTNLAQLNPEWTDLSYNALWTDDPGLQGFLSDKDPGWDQTQTIAPAGLAAEAMDYSSVHLTWVPIPYVNDDGGYEVWHSLTPGGGYAPIGTTPDKWGSEFYATGLPPAATHYFVVRTWTNPNGSNGNTVWSEFSAEASTGTPAAPTITLFAPNGGEIWSVGLTHPIQWSADPLISDVRIEYTTDGGGSWMPVVNSTPNDGSYNWPAPPTPSFECGVRVSAVSDPGILDESDDIFTLTDQDDAYEENDWIGEAVPIIAGVYPDLRMVVDGYGALDQDWFRIYVDAGSDLHVRIVAHPLEPVDGNDIDCEIRDAAGNLLVQALSASDTEDLYLADLPANWYYIATNYAPVLNEYTLTAETGDLPIGTITGRVINAAAEGIAGVWVQMLDPSGDQNLHHGAVYTDAEGYYTYSNVPGDYVVLFSTNNPPINYVGEYYDDTSVFAEADRVPILAGQTTLLNDAVLAVGAAVNGRVTRLSDGSPLQNVRVRAYDPATGLAFRQVFTDANGDYSLVGIRPGDVKIRFNLSGYGLQWYDGQTAFGDADIFTLTNGDVLNDIDAALADRGRILGRVTDPWGNGVGGVNVAVYDLSSFLVASVYTRPDGSYTASPLPEGTLKVWFNTGNLPILSEWYNDKPDFASADGVAVLAGQDTVDIDAVLSGQILQVTSPNGNEIWSTGLTHAVTWTTATVFPTTLNNVRIEYSTDDGGSWQTAVDSTPNDGSYDWAAPPAASFDCRIRVSETMTGGGSDISDGRFTLTDQDDAYEENDSQAAATEITPGAYPGLRLIYDSRGVTDPDWFKFYVGAGQDLRVRVAGVPITPPQWEDIDFSIYDEAGHELATAFSGAADETLCLAGLPAGWYFVAVRFADASYEYTLTVETGDLEVGTLSGRVVDTLGHGIPGVYVVLWLPSGIQEELNVYTPTDTDGYYHLTYLPGEYRLEFDTYHPHLNFGGEFYDDKWTIAAADPVSITAGVTHTLADAVLPFGATLNGQVARESDGAPLANVRVVAFNSMNAVVGNVLTNASGDYTIIGLRPDDVTVRFTKGGFAAEWFDNQPDQASATVLTLAEGEVRPDINAALGIQGFLTGRVINPSGAGIPGVNVVAYDLGGIALASTNTSPAGTFSLGMLNTTQVKLFFNAASTAYQSEWWHDKADFAAADSVAATAGVMFDLGEAVLAPCALAVLSPDGDEIWNTSLAHAITWTVDPQIAAVGIDYSLDDGGSWNTLTDSTPNDGAYEWTTPGTPSSYCRVRVRAANDPGFFDISDGLFTLTDQDDGFEENDTMETATVVTPGVYAGLRMVVDDRGVMDADWYKVWVDEGEDLRVTINADELVPVEPLYDDIDFSIYDEGGVFLSGAISSSPYEHVCLADLPAGWYYIANVYVGTLYEYTMTVEKGLLPIGTLAGRVVDSLGAGIAGVNVEVNVPNGDWTLAAGIAITDVDGYYTFAREPGDFRIFFNTVRPNLNYLGEWYDDQPTIATAGIVTIVEGEATPLNAAVLAPGASISGLVTRASDGTPLDLVRIRAYDAAGVQVRALVGNADGTYTLAGIPPGPIRVRFNRSGHATEFWNDRVDYASADVLTLAPGDELTGIDAQLVPGGAVYGRVSDTQGNGIGGVIATAYDPAGVFLNSVGTNPDGTYGFGQMNTASIKVFFNASATPFESEWFNDQPDLASADLVPVTAGSSVNGIDAVLAPRGIQVLSPNGGEIWSSGRNHPVTWSASPTCLNVRIEYSTDGGGNWTQVVDSTPNDGTFDWTIPAAHSGDCWIRVSDAAVPPVNDTSDSYFMLTDQDDEFEENDTQSTASEILPGVYENLHFLVLGPYDTFDPDWYRVHVGEGQDLRVHLEAEPLDPGSDNDVDIDIFDEAGHLLVASLGNAPVETLYLADLPAGWYYLTNTYTNFNYSYSLTVETGNFELGTLAGRVVDEDGAGISNVWVELNDLSYNWALSPGYVLTDADGYYRFDHPGTTVKIQYNTGRNGLNYAYEWYDNKLEFATADPVTITAGSTNTLPDVVLTSGATIQGRVTRLSNGQPLGNTQARAFDAAGVMRAWVNTDGAGNYSLAGVPPGEIRLRFQRNGFATEWFNDRPDFAAADVLTLAAGDVMTGVNAALAGQGLLAGRVVNGSGAPISGVTVRAWDTSTILTSSGVTAPDGTYLIGLLGTASVRLQFDASATPYQTEWWHDQADFASANPVAVTAGTTAELGDAVLGPRGITVTSPNGQEIWSVGLAHDVTWTVAGTAANVRIDYSTDGGGTWLPVIASTPNDGVYEWTAPATPSDECVVRVADALVPSVADASDDVFTLTDQDDAYEENDDWTSAAPIMPGILSGLKLVMNGYGTVDNDWFAVLVSAGQDLRVTFDGQAETPASYEDVDLEIRDAAGTVLVQGIGGSALETIYAADLPAGWYYIGTNYASDTFTYDLTVEVGDLPIGTAAGRVVDGLGAGIAGVRVEFQEPAGDWNLMRGAAFTDADGYYRLSSTACDSKVFFNPTVMGLNYQTEFYDNKPDFASADLVAITAGATNSLNDAVLADGGMIAGRTLWYNGSPATGVTVAAYSLAGALVQTGASDSNGDYVVYGLPGGDFKIRFSRGPWLGIEWYREMPSFADAQTVQVNVGETTALLDETLDWAGHVTGRVTDSGGNGIPGIRVRVYDLSNFLQSTSLTDADGHYESIQLTPGPAKVLFDATGMSYQSEWYDDKGSFPEADTLVVPYHDTLPGIDAVLVPCTLRITDNPRSQSVTPGLTATLSVAVESTLPVSYQWYQGLTGDTAIPIPGATAPSYMTPLLWANQEYWVRVSGGCGTLDSATATVTVVGSCATPGAPLLMAPANIPIGTEYYTVSWSDTSPDDRYELQEATAPDFSDALTVQVVGTDILLTHTPPAVTYYYYRVRAVALCNGALYPSVWSNVDHTCVNTHSPEPADLDHSGYVSIEDLVILAEWLAGNLEGAFWPDLNEDGAVNAADVDWLLHFLNGTFKRAPGGKE